MLMEFLVLSHWSITSPTSGPMSYSQQSKTKMTSKMSSLLLRPFRSSRSFIRDSKVGTNIMDKTLWMIKSLLTIKLKKTSSSISSALCTKRSRNTLWIRVRTVNSGSNTMLSTGPSTKSTIWATYLRQRIDLSTKWARTLSQEFITLTISSLTIGFQGS